MTDEKPAGLPLTTLLGQTIVFTSLDPVPRGMRTGPGMVVLNAREFAALRNNDGALWKDLIAMIQEDDRARLREVVREAFQRGGRRGLPR